MATRNVDEMFQEAFEKHNRIPLSCFAFVGKNGSTYTLRERKKENHAATRVNLSAMVGEDWIRDGITTGKPGSKQRIDDLRAYYENGHGDISPFE